MTPIEFPEMNGVAAKDQPEYGNLPMFRDENGVVSCWKLSLRERLKVLFTGRIWIHLLIDGGNYITPSWLGVDCPLIDPLNQND